MMTNKPNILFVCARNKKRSRTAESIFKNDNRFNVRSAGLGAKSNIKISDKHIDWAHIILVMEDGHKNRILGQFRHLEMPNIEVLNIEDDYEYLDSELVQILNERINGVLNVVFNIK